MREVVVHYCEDCPIITMCRDEGRECDFTRYVHKIVSEAPPLSEEQVQRIATLLRPYIKAATSGQPEKRRRPQALPGPFTCRVPGCLAAPLKNRKVLWQHLRKMHDISITDYRATYGDPVPLTPDELSTLAVEVTCPVEGCGQAYSTREGHRYPRQALVSHLRGHHGIKERPEDL